MRRPIVARIEKKEVCMGRNFQDRVDEKLLWPGLFIFPQKFTVKSLVKSVKIVPTHGKINEIRPVSDSTERRDFS